MKELAQPPIRSVRGKYVEILLKIECQTVWAEPVRSKTFGDSFYVA